jgi:hypothetical protein
MMAARLMVIEGISAYRALTQAGYARSTARAFGMLLRGSWGLREALRVVQQETGHYLMPRPSRKRKRYDRRPVALAVRQYVAHDIQATTTNTFLRKLHADAKNADAVALGLSLLPVKCSLCWGRLEGRDFWCPRCRRVEKE